MTAGRADPAAAASDITSSRPALAAIASSTGSFTTVWNGTDGYAYGVGWRVVKEVWSAEESDEGTTVDGALDSFVRFSEHACSKNSSSNTSHTVEPQIHSWGC